MSPVFKRKTELPVVCAILRPDADAEDSQTDPSEVGDDELLRRYCETGSEDAFSQIVYRHAGWVYHFCRRRLHDAHLAEDATQAVFLLLARKIVSIPPPAHLAGWLFQATRYVLAETRRRDQRYRRRQDIAREVMVQRITSAAAADSAPESHTSAALDEALVRLRPRERQTILMHFYEGLTLRQMAQQLGISKEGAKKRVNRALAQLRRRLEGKIRGMPGRETAASLGAIVWLLGTRRCEAAPGGLAEAVARSAAVPGAASATAELLVHGVSRSMARARDKLLATLLVLALELILIVPVGLMLGRSTHQSSSGNAPPSTAAPSRPRSLIASAGPISQSQLAAAPSTEPGNWIEDSGSPLPGPYLHTDEQPPTPPKAAPPRADPLPRVAQEPKEASGLPSGGKAAKPAEEVAQAATAAPASTSGVKLPLLALTNPAMTVKPLTIPFSDIKTIVVQSVARAADPVEREKPEDAPAPRPRPDKPIHEPPSSPPPVDRPPFDEVHTPHGPRRRFRFDDAMASIRGQRGDDRHPILRDLPSTGEHRSFHPLDIKFHDERHRFAGAARHHDRHPLEFANDWPEELLFPKEPATVGVFSPPPRQHAYAALSEVVAFFDHHGAWPKTENLLADVHASFASSAFFATPVPEPATIGIFFLLTSLLTFRKKSGRSRWRPTVRGGREIVRRAFAPSVTARTSAASAWAMFRAFAAAASAAANS